MSVEKAAASLHKLRGSAGLLGAKSVQDLAAEGEERLGQGDPLPELTSLLASLSQALSALRGSASAWLAQALDKADSGQAAPLSDGPARYGVLLDLLRQQDLDAGSALKSLRPWFFERGLSTQDVAAIEAHVDELDFEQALRLLEARQLLT